MVSRFNSIRIDGLFGNSEPKIIQFDNLEDPVKILYGVNGSGKTTIMKIIQHSYCWNPIELMKLPFESITYDMNRRGSYMKSCDFQQPPERRNKLEAGQDFSDYVEWDVDDIDKQIKKKIDEWDDLISDHENWREELKKLQNETFAKSYQNDMERKSDKQNIASLQTNIKNLQSQFEKIPYELNDLLLVKRDDLIESNGDDYDTDWDDGLSLLLDYDSEIIIELNREFDYSTKLTIKKIENRVEEIYFDSIGEYVSIEIGNSFHIKEEKEPVLEFENKIIEKTLQVLHKLWSLRSNSLTLQGLYWRFEDLFSQSSKEYMLRMPDYYDYWDIDWKKIEEKMTGYSITRPTNSQLLIERKDAVKIMTHKDTRHPDYVDVDLFLKVHLSQELITHAKKGIRNNAGDYDQHYSQNMRTPSILSEFFSYPQVLISPERRVPVTDDLEKRIRREMRAHGRQISDTIPEKYLVSLPKILNISTDRKNDNEYFESFIKDYNRLALEQKDTVDKLYQKLAKGCPIYAPNLQSLGGGDREDLTYKINNLFFSKFGTQKIIESLSNSIDLSDDFTMVIDYIKNSKIIRYNPVAGNEFPSEYRFWADALESPVNSEKGVFAKEDFYNTVVTPMEITESLGALLRISELKRFEEYLGDKFPKTEFDLFNNSIKSKSKFTDKETKLEFSGLSSGIRQKFRLLSSMAMQIIYSENSLILIDEPEISLHLSWQRTFVDDITHFLEFISSEFRSDSNQKDKLQNILSILISTHSPAILANHYHRGQQIGESDFSD
tara:strand:+ start:12 stop:2345 length:2334 start_codon:yes stop_codon:yes gene_type:complete